MEHNKTVDCYDKHTDAYDTYQYAVIPHYRTALDMVVATLCEYTCTAPCILDLGCGTGNASSAVLKALPEARLYLIDGSASSLDKAVKKIGSQAPESLLGHSCADLADAGWHRSLPCTFDAVISTFVLEHLPEPEYRNVIGNCTGLLNPGGWLIAVESYTEKERDLISWFEKLMKENEQNMVDTQTASTVSRLRTREEKHFFFPKAVKKMWWEECGLIDCHIVWQYLCIALMAGRAKDTNDL